MGTWVEGEGLYLSHQLRLRSVMCVCVSYPYRFFPFCAKTVSGRLIKLSDF